MRSALADLARQSPQHQTRYEVLFTAPIPPGHKRMSDDTHAELRRTVAAVVEAVGLVRPHHLGFTSSLSAVPGDQPSTATQLAAVSGAAVVVPLALPLESSETLVDLDRTLAAVAEGVGVTWFRAETVSGRPTFTRALVDLIRQAEVEAGWRKSTGERQD